MADAFKQNDTKAMQDLLVEWQKLGGTKTLSEVQKLLFSQQKVKSLTLSQAGWSMPTYRAYNNTLSATHIKPPAVPDPPPEPITSTEELIGYRRWLLRLDLLDGPRLASITAKKIWEGPVYQSPEPPGFYREHADGHNQHTLGIYANKFQRYLEHVYAERGTQGIGYVYGVVRLSGIVIEHTYGYRAERAVIDTILSDNEAYGTWVYEAIGKFYGCEVMSYEDWKARTDSQDRARSDAEGSES